MAGALQPRCHTIRSIDAKSRDSTVHMPTLNLAAIGRLSLFTAQHSRKAHLHVYQTVWFFAPAAWQGAIDKWTSFPLKSRY